MRLDEILNALKSSTRRQIIQILAEKPYSGMRVYLKAKESDPKTPRREAIYKELQKLVEIGLVEKKYSMEFKEIQYELSFTDFSLHFPDMSYKIK